LAVPLSVEPLGSAGRKNSIRVAAGTPRRWCNPLLGKELPMSALEGFEADPVDVVEQETRLDGELVDSGVVEPATRDPEVPEADAVEQGEEVLDDEEEPR
jgi:hypothetical protein